MYPTIIRIGPLTLQAYGLMMALGFGAALFVWHRLSRGTSRDLDALSVMMLWIMLSGLAGARVAHVLEYWEDFARNPWLILRIDRGGLVFYGGVLGAVLGLWAFAARRRESLLELMDLVVVGLPLGHAMGRFGCLLNGCCFGRLYAGGLAIRFPFGSLAWLEHYEKGWIGAADNFSRPVFPSQIVESLLNLLIFALLFVSYKRRRFRGAVIGLYFLLYPLQRMLLEPLRGDPRAVLAGYTIAQVISLPMLAAGGVLLVSGFLRNRSGRRLAPSRTGDSRRPPRGE